MLAALRVHHVLFILTLTTYVVGQTVQARYGHSKLVATRFDDSSSQIRASASGFNPSNIQTPVGSEIQILFTPGTVRFKQSSMVTPCIPTCCLDSETGGGAVGPAVNGNFTFTLTSSEPIFFMNYLNEQANLCQGGAIGAFNAPADFFVQAVANAKAGGGVALPSSSANGGTTKPTQTTQQQQPQATVNSDNPGNSGNSGNSGTTSQGTSQQGSAESGSPQSSIAVDRTPTDTSQSPSTTKSNPTGGASVGSPTTQANGTNSSVGASGSADSSLSSTTLPAGSSSSGGAALGDTSESRKSSSGLVKGLVGGLIALACIVLVILGLRFCKRKDGRRIQIPFISRGKTRSDEEKGISPYVPAVAEDRHNDNPPPVPSVAEDQNTTSSSVPGTSISAHAGSTFTPPASSHVLSVVAESSYTGDVSDAPPPYFPANADSSACQLEVGAKGVIPFPPRPISTSSATPTYSTPGSPRTVSLISESVGFPSDHNEQDRLHLAYIYSHQSNPSTSNTDNTIATVAGATFSTRNS